MAEYFEFDCRGHNSIYKQNYLENNYEERNFKVYYSTPTKGINFETGILLFIAGFGGNSNSNIYKKMRQKFADIYNLVTVQCDYFGWEFMQSEISFKDIVLTEDSLNILNEYGIPSNKDKTINLDEIIMSKKTLNLKATTEFNECLENFSDMSYMQALDNITAVLNVINILYNNKEHFNTNKIIIMGQSHGSYLAYLSNIMCSNLFTHILDNSAWDYPHSLKSCRVLPFKFGSNFNVTLDINYLARNMNFNTDYLRLSNLYENKNNNCSIVSYHGEDDSLIPLDKKIAELSNINNTELNVISKQDLGSGIFTNTHHGLGADFNKLFDSFNKKYLKEIGINSTLNFENNIILNNSNLEIDYTYGIPIVINRGELFSKSN